MTAAQETIKLMELLQQNLVEGNYQVLKNIAEQPGIHPVIREKVLTISKLFQETTLQSNIHQIDVFFYRDCLKELLNGQITEANINNRLDISRQKKEEVIQLLKRIRYNQQSRISAQSELKIKKKEVEQLRNQSSMKVDLEKEYTEKQSKLQRKVYQYELQIQNLKSNIQSQVQIIKETMDHQHNYIEQLKQKEEEIIKLKEREKEKNDQIFKLKFLVSEINEQLSQSKLLLSQQSKKSQVLSQQISKQSHIHEDFVKKENYYQTVISSHLQQTDKLKQEIKLLQGHLEDLKATKVIKRRSTKDLFIDNNSLIQQFQMNQEAANSFHQTLTKKLGEITSMSSLYNYSLNKGENFHKRVDNKKNILLLCLTKDNRIIGGFSSSGFSLKNDKENTKAFIFSFYNDQMKVFDLKKGKQSTLYDNDFLIFGNEQLCIEKGSDTLNSNFVNLSRNALHYDYNNVEDKETFLSIDQGKKGSVVLANYEVIQLNIRND